MKKLHNFSMKTEVSLLSLLFIASYLIIIFSAFRIGDLDFLEIDFSKIVQITFLFFGLLIAIFSIITLYALFIPFLMGEFGVNFFNGNTDMESDQVLGIYQKTSLSYLYLLISLICLISDNGDYPISIVLIILVFYFTIPYIYDLARYRIKSFEMKRFLRYSATSTAVIGMFYSATSFVLLSFYMGKSDNAALLFFALFLVGCVGMPYFQKTRESYLRPTDLFFLILAFLMSGAPIEISKQFARKMRIMDYPVDSIYFENKTSCEEFSNKLMTIFGNNNEDKVIKISCTKLLAPFKEGQVKVVTSAESRNHLFEIDGKRFRFKKEFVDVRAASLPKRDSALVNYLFSMKFYIPKWMLDS